MAAGSTTFNDATTVTQLKGELFLVMADGSRRLVEEGELLPQGAVVISLGSTSFVANGQAYELVAAPQATTNTEEEEEEETLSSFNEINNLQA
ncbi:MAG: hypothetical protein ACRC9V_00730, partial [Aeromonas sp.]